MGIRNGTLFAFHERGATASELGKEGSEMVGIELEADESTLGPRSGGKGMNEGCSDDC
jgi:hypothetical protein